MEDQLMITDMGDQQDFLQSMVDDLTFKEQIANVEIEDAQKVALTILRKYGSTKKIGIKTAGAIDTRPWKVPCREKYMYDQGGWQLKMTRLVSEWEELLRDPAYRPFGVVEVGPDKFEYRFLEDDKKLKQLKEDLGDEVRTTVTDALLEREEYNANGRYCIELAWDFEKNRRVVLKDLLLYMKELLDGAKDKPKH